MSHTSNTTPRPTLAVIDGNSLMHRAFHGIRQPMSAPDGRATNALFGFFNMLLKLVDSFKPDALICAFDKGRPQVRMNMLPQYKAQRPHMDPDLRVQFPMVKELLAALGIPVCEAEGWEGDDILGTLARQGEEQGCNVLLFTGDRDMYQLSTEHVHIVSTRKGVSDVAIMDPASVEDLYHGVTPELIPDFYGLKGDSSDNIPGVPGIGPKKAAALIVEYGSLDEVIAHADEVPGKMGENLRAHIDDALISRKVATILTNAPVELDLASAKFPDFDQATAIQAFSALGFTGMMTRIAKLMGPVPAGGFAAARAAASASTEVGEAADAPAAIELSAPLVDEAAHKALEKALNDKIWVGCSLVADTLTRSLFEPAHVLWVAFENTLARFEGNDVADVLVKLFKTGRITSADVKSLLHLVSPVDSSIEEKFAPLAADPDRLFDVAVAAYLIDSNRSDFEATALAEAYLPIVLPEPTEEVPETALAAVLCERLVQPLRTHLQNEGAERLFNEVEMPLLPVLAHMERIGLAVDASILASQSAELGAEIAQMVASIHETCGEDFNLDSPQQLSHILFEVLKLPTVGLKRTKRGFYSTNAKILAELASEYDIVARVLEYRERSKIKSTYLDALPSLIQGDKRIHTRLNQTVTATGRLSSSDPNLQNIPTRSELGHRVRQAFVVPEDHVFLACDYSQIELRLLAHLSEDEHLISAFCDGADFHAATAARVFDVPVAEVTPALRSRAKAVNFGIVYGQQAFGLATSLHIPRAEAQAMIDRYFEAYPGVRAFLDRAVSDAKRLGYAETIWGRRRYIPEFKQRNRQLVAFGERTAMNHPMQGTAADIIKIAMIRVAKRLEEEKLASRLVLQIHDELDLEVPTAEIETVAALVRETMEGVAELRVPLLAEASWGPNWAEAK